MATSGARVGSSLMPAPARWLRARSDSGRPTRPDTNRRGYHHGQEARIAQGDPEIRRYGGAPRSGRGGCRRSEEHTSELQSLMRTSYAVFCLKKTNKTSTHKT